ncbi:50S ribosomal protein L30 [Candidatus Pyrohabitans sp.]
MRRLSVVRVRGRVGVPQEVEDTLTMLRLTRVNHCVFIDDRPTYAGMLQKVKDYITWGEVSADEVALILRRRGELVGGEKLTDAYVKEHTRFKSIDDFAKAFVDFKAELSDIPDLKPVFRLHPPRKGYRGIKRSFVEGAALGYRGEAMKELLRRMR